MKSTPIRVLDLFAGAGGLTAGFREASTRFTSVAAVEMDIAASASYAATFGIGKVFAGRIEDWLVKEAPSFSESVDIIVGGPPCQGFSTLGKRQVDDNRNSLWRQYAETLRVVKPKYFIVENVAAFAASPQFALFVDETSGGILSDYSFEHRILNSADYGTPQARKRAVIIGHHRDLPFPEFPEATHVSPRNTSSKLPLHLHVGDILKSVPLQPDRDHLFTERRTRFGGREFPGAFSPRDLHWGRNYTQLSLDRFAEIPIGGSRFDLPDHLLAPCWRKHKTGSGDVMGRLHADRPSVTIRTEFFKPEKGRYLHPTEDRAITHYEAALLQGFPDSHRFIGSRTEIARQIGNAVPIPLGAAVARQLLAGMERV